jgi:hypothetical protein
MFVKVRDLLTRLSTVDRPKDGRVNKIYHPAVGGPTLGWNEATDVQWPERVVILSSVLRVAHG